jgi:hypothetical protein
MRRVLLYTNLLLVISLIYFFFYSNKNCMETMLALTLVAVIISSQMFWRNSIKGTKLHAIDAILAKICIFSFILYTITYKIQSTEIAIIYSILLFYIGLAAWSSNKHSKIQWCSPDHIKSHAFLHYFCFMATFFAFLQLV